MSTTATTPNAPPTRQRHWYSSMWAQVTVGIALATVFGYMSPARAIAMKPLGDAFIRIITMIITLMIFCTVVTGIAGMRDLRKVGRVGGKALLYFEIVSTLGLVVGLIVGNVVKPGNGFNVNVAVVEQSGVSHGRYRHALRSDRSLWRDGIYDRKVRPVVARAVAETYCVVLDDVHSFRDRCVRHDCVGRWIQPVQISRSH